MMGYSDESRDVLEQVMGHMIRKSIESGIVKKGEMVVILEDLIQSLERGTLQAALEFV
ncbi:MAG: hypothetical protein MN733_25945 [Nitrososphaera sp.]|nr:hypothetical protein [Nitrososphaera sp.]